jgi:hypothetical protein
MATSLPSLLIFLLSVVQDLIISASGWWGWWGGGGEGGGGCSQMQRQHKAWSSTEYLHMLLGVHSSDLTIWFRNINV